MRKQAVVGFFQDLRNYSTKNRLCVLLIIVCFSYYMCVKGMFADWGNLVALGFATWVGNSYRVKINPLLYLVPLDKRKIGTYIQVKVVGLICLNVLFYLSMIGVAVLFHNIPWEYEIQKYMIQMFPMIVCYCMLGEDMWYVSNKDIETMEINIEVNEKKRKCTILMIVVLVFTLINFSCNSNDTFAQMTAGYVGLMAIAYIGVGILYFFFIRYVNEKVKDYENVINQR